jgi:cytochrome c oxidase subunit 2
MSLTSPLAPMSPQAQTLADVFYLVLIISAVIFAVVIGLVLYIAVRYRSRPGSAEPPPNFGVRNLELVWTFVPVLIVAGLFVVTLRTMRAVDPPAPPERQPDLVVIGHQWWWEARYPATGVVTANEIHLPVGKRLLMRLESADVIHDFWVPRLGRKIDAVPGHPNQMWIEVGTPGTYLGACSEFCGVQHAWMRLMIIAQPQGAFDAWQEAQQQRPAPPATARVAQGAELFRQLACGSCHAVAGTAAQARIGPDLTHLASRRTLGAGVLENTRANLARWLRNPQAVKTGSYMPDFSLTHTEVEQLVAYLETLK